MDEFSIIEQFFARRAAERGDVRLGIGDDAAIVAPEPGCELVIATDTINEDTHFPAGAPARAIGHRSLAVNLSDLAAMGAAPWWCTMSLSLPKAETDWLAEFADGFFDLATRFGIALIGGDTVRGPLSVSVTVCGRVESGAAVRRSGAAPGQDIYVTGWPGEAAAGLSQIQAGGGSDSRLVDRFLYPEPRVEQGRMLSAFATSMIDLSDGLHVDLERLVTASDCGASVCVDDVPCSDALREAVGAEAAAQLALTGGDDYELCFTLRPEDVRRLGGIGCPVARIGRTDDGSGVRWTFAGEPYVPSGSFRHF